MGKRHERMKTSNAKLAEALKSILDTAKNHPAFDGDAFERHDIDSLVQQGGDVCDWTMIAITAADALKDE